MLLLGVSRFRDLQTTENMQVVTQNLCSLYWSRDIALVAFFHMTSKENINFALQLMYFQLSENRESVKLQVTT